MPYRLGMRTGRLVLVAAVLLALAGCTPVSPHSSGSPSASAMPVFASDAEALAAAEKAYAAYLKVSDAIAQDGGKDPERILKVSTGQVAADDLAGYSDFVSNGWHSTGSSKIRRATLESAGSSPSMTAAEVMTAYICEDVSDVDVIDARGKSVVSSNRPNLQPFEVEFDFVEGSLLLSARRVWTGANICDV